MNQASSTKPNPNPIPSSNPNQNPSSLNNNARLATAECGNCGSPNRWVLHHVRIRGIHRRLCTTCVLRLHPSLFCPGCFQFYDSNNVPPPSKRLTCSKCSSFTHSHCAQPPTAPPTSLASASSSSSASYLCPACASPNFNFFDIDSEPNRAIDKRLALVLLCAAKISAASMTKAVIVARAEAERRVREAALARKRAKEALDNLAILFHSKGDKAMRKDIVGEGSAEVSGSRKAPLAQNSQVGKMFNGFTPPPRQSTVMLGSSQPSEKNDNREPKPVIDHHHHRPTLQSNGNVYEKDKSAAMDVDKEKVKLEPKIQ